ncbi:MAG: hypothetical protein RSE41_03705, partial [Clostridia bacterium]
MDMKYKEYSNDVIDSLLYLDYCKGELDKISDYFKSLIGEEISVRAFFEESVEKYTEYVNSMFKSIKRISSRLEINNQSKVLAELNELIKEKHNNVFTTYSEESNEECLIN